MKNVRFYFKGLIAGLAIAFSSQVTAQSNLWVMPPYYVFHDELGNVSLNSLPTDLTVSDPVIAYKGGAATTVANGMQDANGELLFFIVDGIFYDSDGDAIGVIDYIINLPEEIKGTAEVSIVPSPGSCSRFYIFLAGRNNYSGNGSKVPYYVILDMTEPSSHAEGKMGNIIHVDKLQSLIPSWEPSIVPNSSKQGSVYFAVSEENNEERFVFVSDRNNVFRFILNNSGIHFDGTIDVGLDTGLNDIAFRSGMELVRVENSSIKYRLSLSLPFDPQGNNQTSENVVCVFNLDENGDISTDENGFERYYLPYVNYGGLSIDDRPQVHGLEFSPDGNILYITHKTNIYYQNAFEYFDFNNHAVGVQSVPGISVQDALNFEFSQIEIGRDGKLYLAYENGIATFSNPNNPSLGSLDLNALNFSYSSNREGSELNDLRFKSYLFPDQIDGMDYKNSIEYVVTETVANYVALNDGVWKPGSNPWGINNGDILVLEELKIPVGRDITIKDMTFRFALDAKVIVEQGAKLTLDNTIFTNNKLDCDLDDREYWKGIQVFGTSNKNQYPKLNPTHQGMIVIKNNSVIEYARLGVVNWKDDKWDSIGGVIQASNSLFRNNRKDVAFMSYNNFSQGNPSVILDNTSYFKDCEFISDDFFIEEASSPLAHVTLWAVKGVSFQNCSFKNEVNKINSSSPNRGVYSVDAGFSVLARCTTVPALGAQCPSSSLLRSKFKGFQNAIEATGAGTTETVKIQQSEFIDNVRDISIFELDNASINRNEIITGNAVLTPVFPYATGVSIENSTGFLVEENDISTSLTNGISFGVSVKNSGGDDNLIYKNKLSNLEIGLYGLGINHDGNYQQGLQFKCNTLSTNHQAIQIGSDILTDGVRFYQGEFSPPTFPGDDYSTISAGNQFVNNASDINNFANSIVYFEDEAIIPSILYSGYVTLEPAKTLNSCPSSFSGFLIIEPLLLALDSLNGRYYVLKSDYNDLKFTYFSLIDQGDTEGLKEELESNWSEDVWSLRGKLLESSPYLSSEILLEVAKQNVLPNGMLLEILLANPDAIRGERFVESLKEATLNSFPEYMLDYLRNGFDDKTLRTFLEIELATLHSELSNTKNWINHITKSMDELTNDEKMSVLELGSELFDKIGLMDFYIENLEFENAENILNSIKNNDRYREELNLVENYDEYISFRSNLRERNIAQLNSTEINYLVYLAEDEGRVAGYAKNILCFFYDICYERELMVDEFGLKSSSVTIPEKSLEDILYNVELYPNPAVDYTSIKWEIYDEIKEAHYVIVDINGREINRGDVLENKGEIVIDTRNLRQGIYIIGIYNKNGLKANKKLMVDGQK